MSSEWADRPLGEFVRLQRGHDLTATEQRPGHVPVLGSAGANGTHDESLAKGPGVVIGRSGASIGRVHFTEIDFWPHNTCLYVTDFLGNNPRFAYYLLQTLNLAAFNSGSAQPSLNRNFVYSIRVQVPRRSEQDAVAEVLQSLDDRIALLRETNATLEAIAQALFKSWFVDFDPVRAKSQGLAPAGMDEATAALFPDGFEESERGSMPRGWRAGTLAECAWLNEQSWSSRHRPERLWYLDLANVKNNEVASAQSFLFNEAPSRARRVLRDGDTIVGTVRPGNRSFAYVHEPIAGLTGSTGFAVLSPRSTEFAAFTYLAATQDVSIEHLSHVADGGAYPAVRPEVVAALPCAMPAADVLRVFSDVARPLLQKVAINQARAQTLAVLRDTLLPRLISGQLRLTPADEAIAEGSV